MSAPATLTGKKSLMTMAEPTSNEASADPTVTLPIEEPDVVKPVEIATKELDVHNKPLENSNTTTVEDARAALNTNVVKNYVDETSLKHLKLLIKDYDSLKDKVSKLKSLLGRSAKAQREAKVDLDVTQKRLDQALREIERLKKKIEKLSNRPTHMELLADFETNFDRALLSVESTHHQAGGQDTASPAVVMTHHATENETAIVDNLLMQELQESRERNEKLEQLNKTLVNRSMQMENEARERRRERDELFQKVTHLELEKRMAVMEAEHAMKALQEKAASLEEMQMEIDLVTKASVSANVRAAQGEEMMKTVKTDKQYVQQLEAKVQALQEWALASSEAKTIAQERVRFLETQLRNYQLSNKTVEDNGRVLLSKNGSMVIGAGDVGVRVVELDTEHVRSLKLSERVVLRWKFDLTSEDSNIEFSLLKGSCEDPGKRRGASYLVKDRQVKGGAAGETDDAFSTERACTLIWSNSKSWIRPRTVKYTLAAVVLSD